MGKLGIAIIGLRMGYGHFRNAQAIPGTQLTAVCDLKEDHMIANAKFKNGAIGRILNSSGCPRPYNIECEVWGTEGTICGDNTRDSALLALRRTGYKQWLNYPKDTMSKAIGNEIGHFVDCVQTDKTPLIDGVDGAKTIATCWAVIESIANGAPVNVRNEF